MKKEETIIKVLSRYLKSRLDTLEKNFITHSNKIQESFDLIEKMKQTANKLIEEDNSSNNNTQNNIDLSKSFCSTSSKSNLNKSGRTAKTPLKSRTTINLIEKSTERNKSTNKKVTARNSLTKSKTKTNIKIHTDRGISNDILKGSFVSNNSNINRIDTSPINKKMKTPTRDVSPDLIKGKIYIKTPIQPFKTVKTGEKNKLQDPKNNNTIISNTLNLKNKNSVKNFKISNDERYLTLPNISKNTSELDNDFNVSKIIAVDQGLDDSLINNKDDPFDQVSHNHNNNIFNVIKTEIKSIIKLEYEEILDDRWESDISKFFTDSDLMKFILINKKFGKLSISILLKEYEELKANLESKINIINKNTNNTEKSHDVFNLSKATNKAVELLNDNFSNNLFTENTVPNQDILIVYMLYFQIIKHPINNLRGNKSKFWKETCKYFTHESNNKTGYILVNSIKKADTSNLNLYKIYKLIGNNSNKITPNYFSKLCGTTGLIVFLVKDFIDYLGIGCDKKSSVSNSLKNLSSILNLVNYNLQKLKCISEKYFNIN